MRPNYHYPPKPVDRPDHISALIPTRARPDKLKTVFDNFQETLEHRSLFDVWMYVDDDDTLTLDYIRNGDWKRYDFTINWLVTKSSWSMGDMDNYLWQHCTTNSGLYFPFGDDYTIQTEHWDTLLHEAFNRFDDGLMLGFLPDHTVQPHQITFMIPSAKWLNILGYLLTNRFYFWFDDQWVDEIAQMVDRKIMIPIFLNTPKGRGKTQRMRNLPFWARYFNLTLEDRYNDALSMIRTVYGDNPALMEAALTKAKQAAAALISRFNAHQNDLYVQMETTYRDTSSMPRPENIARYLTTELYALNDLSSKLQQAYEKDAYPDVVDLTDTMSLASLKTSDTEYLKATALAKMDYPHDAITALHRCIEVGSSSIQDAAHSLLGELKKVLPSHARSYYTSRSELRMPSWLTEVDLDIILFSDRITQELYFSIQRLIYEYEINTIIDIGSGTGAGSTHAVTSLFNQPANLVIFCIEPDRKKCDELAIRFGGKVHIYNGSSILQDEYMTEDEVNRHYHNTPTIVNHYPLDTVLQWRRDELRQHDVEGIDWGCIHNIKNNHRLTRFDMAILDGSLFSGPADLAAVYGTHFLILNHVRSIKNHNNLTRLLSDGNYKVRELNVTTGCGYAVFERIVTNHISQPIQANAHHEHISSKSPSMFQITELYNQIVQPGLINELTTRAISHFQDNVYFRLAYEQQKRREYLQGIFREKSHLKVFISNNLRHLMIHSTQMQVNYLDDHFFRETSPATFRHNCSLLQGTIVIVNNNDAHNNGSAETYVQMFNHCADTLFIVWDWDNHHWLSLSPVLASHSDLYVPTHPDNHYALSRFNAAITDPVAAGVVQWTWDFLESHTAELVNFTRSNKPLGKHIPYSPFQYRSQVVTTLNQYFDTIGFTTRQFHELTQEQKFAEWCSYKSHWIIPVLNDIQIRVFDAFVTGGIPLLPESLRFTRWLSDAHADDVLFYSAANLITPRGLVEQANKLFDTAGITGIERRYHYAMDRHHGDNRLREIINYASHLFGFIPE